MLAETSYFSGAPLKTLSIKTSKLSGRGSAHQDVIYVQDAKNHPSFLAAGAS